MKHENTDFFTNNILAINRLIAKVLAGLVFVPVIFFILSKAHIYSLSTQYCVIQFCLVLFFTISVLLLNRAKSKAAHIFTMYYALIGMELSMAFMMANSKISILATPAIVPFLVCLYYNKRLTKFISVFCYVCMLGALFIRANDMVLNGFDRGRDALHWFIVLGSGYTIEFFFIIMATYALTYRTNYSLNHLIDSDTRNRNLAQLLEEQAEQLEQKNSELVHTQMDIVEFIGKVVGSHDLFTGRHAMHTKRYVQIIAFQLRSDGHYADILTDSVISLYSQAAFLHDIGKIHIPEGILNKTGRFTPEEFALMKTHPVEGRKLIAALPKIGDGEFNEIAMEMAFFHHERWDGMGYPNGVAGKEIPLCARIMAAADVLDALVSQRLYKDPMSFDEAMEVFIENRGIHFEPCIADAVLHCRRETEAVDAEFKRAESSSNQSELEWWLAYHNAAKS